MISAFDYRMSSYFRAWRAIRNSSMYQFSLIADSAEERLRCVYREVFSHKFVEKRDRTRRTRGYKRTQPRPPKWLHTKNPRLKAQSAPPQEVNARVAREEHQRLCAIVRRIRAYKSVPKAVRLARIAQERDKRCPARLELEQLESQAGVGKIVSGVVGVFGLKKLWDILGHADGAMKSIRSSVDAFRGFLAGLQRQLNKLLRGVVARLIFVMVLVWILCQLPFVPDWVKEIARAAIKGSVVGVTVQHAYPYLFEPQNMCPQAGPSFNFNTLFTTIMTGLLCKQLGNQRLGSGISVFMSGIAKGIMHAPKVSDGVDMLVDWAVGAINHVIRAAGWVFNRHWEGIKRKDHTALRTWLRKVDETAERHNTGQVKVCPTELALLTNLCAEGTALQQLYRFTHFERGIKSSLITLNGIIQPFLGAVTASNNYRAEPTCVILRGDPGCGKSALCTYFCAAVLLGSGLLPPDSSSARVCSEMFQKGTSEFWNGYAGQMALILDDIFQQRPSPTDKDNEYINLIRMISSWSFPLNFADLTSKGKIFFDSKLVFGTTNVHSFNSEAVKVIAEPVAVNRRIHFAYELKLKDKYKDAKGYWDPSRLAEEIALLEGARGLDAFPWHMWEVHRHDFLTGETAAEALELRTLVDAVIEDVQRRQDLHSRNVETVNDFVGRFQSGEPIVEESPDFEREFASLIEVLRASSPELAAKHEALNAEPFQFTMSWAVALEEYNKLLKREMLMLAKERDEIRLTLEEREEVWREQRRSEREFFKQEQAHFRERYEAALEELEDYEFLRDQELSSLASSESYWKRACQSLVQDVAWWKRVGAIFGGTTLALVAFRGPVVYLLRYIQSALSDLLQFIGVRPRRPKLHAQSNVPEPKLRPQANVDGSHGQYASHRGRIDKLTSNAFKLHLHYARDGKLVVQILGQVNYINGDTFVAPLHFRDIIEKVTEPGAELFFDSLSPGRSFVIPVQRYLESPRHTLEDRHLDFIRIRGLNMAKDVGALYFKAESLKYATGKPVELNLIKTDQKGAVLTHMPMCMTANTVARKPTVLVDRWKVNDVLCYDMRTQVGDCGALLCTQDTLAGSGRVALGIHIAAGNFACAATVTAEDILAANQALGCIRDVAVADLASRGIKLQESEQLPFSFQSSFVPIGTLDPMVNLPTKTAFFPTPGVYGSYGAFTDRPALLAPTMIDGKMVYPMENAVMPYGSQVLTTDPAALDNIAHVAFTPLTEVTRNHTRHLLSFEDAIVGVPEMRFRAVPRGTSAGYPYNTTAQAGKKAFFGDQPAYDLSSAECQALRKRVDNILSRAKEGVRLGHVFTDFNKDEIRSEAKVRAGATRLISSAPLDYTIAWRIMFGTFSAAFMSNHIKHGMAPGICTYSEWKDLYHHLQKKGKKVFDGDFKSFDASEQPDFFNAILRYINRWYDDGEENARVREVLWQDLINSRHIGGRGFRQCFLYQWSKSLPSGHPFTTIVNSMYSLMMLVAAYWVITGRIGDYWTHVSPITYGDDNVSNVSDEMAGVYNQETVASALKERFGMTYTPGNKSGEWVPTMGIEDVTFLKRRFAFRKGKIVCPLELNSFLYVPYYSKNARDYRNIAVDCAENGLEELAMHDESTWADNAHKLKGVITHFGRDTRLFFSQDAYLDAVLARTEWY